MTTHATSPNVEIVRRHYEASERGDLEGMLADLAPDAAWTEMAGFPCAGTYVGRDAIVAGVFDRLDADWDDFEFHLERLCDAGDTVVAIGRYTSVHKRTGKRLDCRVTHVWQLAGGQVRAFEQFCDTLLVDRAAR